MPTIGAYYPKGWWPMSMKKEVKNETEVMTLINDEAATVVHEMRGMSPTLKALFEEICESAEYSILRETLRLYCEEAKVH
jgi:hypothetical protein